MGTGHTLHGSALKNVWPQQKLQTRLSWPELLAGLLERWLHFEFYRT